MFTCIRLLFLLQMMACVSLLGLLCLSCFATAAEKPTVVMSGNYRHHEEGMSDRDSSLRVYCFHGLNKRFFYLWHSVFFNLSKIPDDLEVFIGRNESDVVSKMSETKQSFLSFWWSVAVWKKGFIPVAPFHLSCVGISTVEPYALRLCWKVEFFRVVLFISGIFLFFKAKVLSRHIAFYYSIGISVSLVASIALAVLILHRFIPFRRGFYFLLFISTTTSVAILEYMVRHIESLLFERQTLLITYIAVVSSISFAVLYYYSPRALNTRSYNLIQWGLQVIALLSIFFASQIPEVAVLTVLGILLAYNFPRVVIYRCRAYWHRWFPKPRRYVNEEEYREIVAEATRTALEDLREYCRSPECRSWKLVARLKSPTRFASFVEGESHVTEAEEDVYIEGNRSSSAGPNGDSDMDDESVDAFNDSDESLELRLNSNHGW